MEIRYYQLVIMNERAKREFIEEENNIIGYMNHNGIPSMGKAPKQKIKAKSSLKDFYLASSDLGSRKILSSRSKELFEKNRIENVRYIPCPVIQGNEILKDYWITDLIQFDDQEIDFDRSIFELCEGWVEKEEYGIPIEFGERFREIKFQNLSEKLEFEKKNLNHLSKVRAVKLFIKQNCSLPFLNLREYGVYDIIVSEQLKTEFQKQKMDKGIEFKPLELSDEEWYGPNGLRKQFYN